jgi:hypothetical protein
MSSTLNLDPARQRARPLRVATELRLRDLKEAKALRDELQG